MQLTIDNRIATAEQKLLQLEDLGYRFRVSKHRDGREVYLIKTTAAAIKDIRTSRLMQELEPYRKEVCFILTERAKYYIRECRKRIGGI